MYFMERARQDHKSVAGLETAADQLALFEGLPLPTQADYLLSSLEEAHSLPEEVDAIFQSIAKNPGYKLSVDLAADTHARNRP